MPSAHARLAPSSADRWIACPASIRLGEKAEALGAAPGESVYAAEGTHAHTLAELRVGWLHGFMTDAEYDRRYAAWAHDMDPDAVKEMLEHVTAYAELVDDRLGLYPVSQLFLEQRMPTGIPTCWGTSDTVIVSPRHLEIIDFKYGAGVRVSAEGNPQTRLYALGALSTFGEVLGDVEIVRITIHQPRLGSVSTEELTPAELIEWRDTVALPAARLALTDDAAPFGPSEKACRWCPASGICTARTQRLAELDFGGDPDVLSTSDTAEWLARVPEIKQWCEAVVTSALTRAYSGGEIIPGYKVVRSGGKRAITDPRAAVDALVAAGFSRSDVERVQPQTLGHLEKVVGKTRLPDVLGPLLVKGEGQPALVADDDPRSSIDPLSEARKDFA